MPVTGFGSAVPPASGFVRLRHSRLSGNAHKTLTSQEGIMANQNPLLKSESKLAVFLDLESVEFDFFTAATAVLY